MYTFTKCRHDIVNYKNITWVINSISATGKDFWLVINPLGARKKKIVIEWNELLISYQHISIFILQLNIPSIIIDSGFRNISLNRAQEPIMTVRHSICMDMEV